MPAWISPTGKAPRGTDSWGSGAFAASRGSRPHYGVDYVCEPEQQVVMPCAGVPVRIKRPYADDLTWSGLMIRTPVAEVTLFYVVPGVTWYESLDQNVVIGTAQDISLKYRASDRGPMTPHVHAEVRLLPGTRWPASWSHGRDYLFRPNRGIYIRPELLDDLLTWGQYV